MIRPSQLLGVARFLNLDLDFSPLVVSLEARSVHRAVVSKRLVSASELRHLLVSSTHCSVILLTSLIDLWLEYLSYTDSNLFFLLFNPFFQVLHKILHN